MRGGYVIGTDLSGRGRKVFHKGDYVTEENFPPGNYMKLVASGWIEEKVKSEAPKQEPRVITEKKKK